MVEKTLENVGYFVVCPIAASQGAASAAADAVRRTAALTAPAVEAAKDAASLALLLCEEALGLNE